MLKEGQEIKFEKVVYNLVRHQVFKRYIVMSVKKNINCNVCLELDLMVDAEDGVIDWDTLKKA